MGGMSSDMPPMFLAPAHMARRSKKEAVPILTQPPQHNQTYMSIIEDYS